MRVCLLCGSESEFDEESFSYADDCALCSLMRVMEKRNREQEDYEMWREGIVW